MPSYFRTSHAHHVSYIPTANSFNIMPFSTNVNWLFDMTSSPNDGIFDDFMSYSGDNDLSLPHNDLPGTTSNQFSSTEPVSSDISLLNHVTNMSLAAGQIDVDLMSSQLEQQDKAYSELVSSMSTTSAGIERPVNVISEPAKMNAPLSTSTSTSMKEKRLPIIDESSRDRILEVIDRARPKTIDGVILDGCSELLSLPAMQQYCNLFFQRFNVAYPLLHQATFDPTEVDALLLTAVLLLGATYSGKDAHQMAVGVHDILRAQIIQHPLFNEQPQVWILQTILLVDCFGTSRAGPRQHAMSNMFHGLLHNLIRRSDCQNIRTGPYKNNFMDDNLEARWRREIDLEQRKRLALLCFLWDTQHAVLFSQASCLSAIELRLSLPCNPDIWEATTAEEWNDSCRRNPSTFLFLTVLKSYLNPDARPRPRHLDGFSRTLILHGLMSVFSDMKRRSQTSLGM